MNKNFEMVAKTFQGLEDVLAEELRSLGALNVEPGLRMVSFEGDLEMMYRANLACRTALRILKPIYKFRATDPDMLYDIVKSFDWTSVLSLSKTFAIDVTVFSDVFKHSRYVTYRVKDAIVDFFKDKYGPDKRPGVRVQDADVLINVHIAEDRVTISLDSSGESLHKRGYRVAQTEAPINEVLAAGILLKSGWRGDTALIDPMCGSGTFLIEAALIAANIMPGIYRRKFAFEQWKDFDGDLLDSIYNDDSAEREVTCPIIGADISPAAVNIARSNIKNAGVGKYINLSVKPFQRWTRDEIPTEGVLVMNPPYGERIAVEDMDNLYTTIGSTLKHVFLGYHAWIIAYREEYLRKIGLSPSSKTSLLNGSLPCELREYIIFDGLMSDFRRSGGRIKEAPSEKKPSADKRSDRKNKGQRRLERPERPGREEKGRRYDRRAVDDAATAPRNELERAYRPSKGRFARKPDRFSAERQQRKGGTEGVHPTLDAHADNPLARRRSAEAVRRLADAPIKPSLPPMEGPLLRDRRRKGPRKNDNGSSAPTSTGNNE